MGQLLKLPRSISRQKRSGISGHTDGPYMPLGEEHSAEIIFFTGVRYSRDPEPSKKFSTIKSQLGELQA